VNETQEGPERDKCVSCGADTPHHPSTHIKSRNFYIEGVGQLCKKCYIDIYVRGETK